MKAHQVCTTCIIARDATVALREDGTCALCAGEDPTPYMNENELAYYNGPERRANLTIPGDGYLIGSEETGFMKIGGRMPATPDAVMAAIASTDFSKSPTMTIDSFNPGAIENFALDVLDAAPGTRVDFVAGGIIDRVPFVFGEAEASLLVDAHRRDRDDLCKGCSCGYPSKVTGTFMQCSECKADGVKRLPDYTPVPVPISASGFPGANVKGGITWANAKFNQSYVKTAPERTPAIVGHRGDRMIVDDPNGPSRPEEAIACPACRAVVHEPCRPLWDNKGKLDRSHPARIKAYKDGDIMGSFKIGQRVAVDASNNFVPAKHTSHAIGVVTSSPGQGLIMIAINAGLEKQFGGPEVETSAGYREGDSIPANPNGGKPALVRIGAMVIVPLQTLVGVRGLPADVRATVLRVERVGPDNRPTLVKLRVRRWDTDQQINLTLAPAETVFVGTEVDTEV